MQTLSDVLGKFYVEMNPAVICERLTCNIDAERAKLLGARVCIFNELEPDDKMRVAEVQLLSGADLVPAKPLYKDPISIRPQHQCILTTNHLPSLAEVCIAIIERMIIIPFSVTYCDLNENEQPSQYRRQRDNRLKDRLRDDRSAFVKFIVFGAKAWYESRDLKKSAPSLVKDFTKAYLDDQDSLQKFISVACEQNWRYKESVDHFLHAYNDQNPEHRLTNRSLPSKMRGKGFVKKQIRFGGALVYGFEGIRLINTAFVD